jgi:hypothetical protein
MSGTITTGNLILTKNTANQDAFDRLRVSEPVTLFELNQTKGKLPSIVDEYIIGGATSIAHLDNSYIEMSIAQGTTGKCIRQTYEYIAYQPGKSKLIVISGILETHGGLPNTISRIGCFDSRTEKTYAAGNGNGVFFELNGTDLYAVIRLNDNDTTEKVKQSNWNFDRFDGTGPSGLTLNDYSKCMLFAVDLEWLGIGRVRFGFYINGRLWVGHCFNHSGFGITGLPTNDGITGSYIKTAKLPVRHEISCNATGGLTGPEMRMQCTSILSEGGYEVSGMSLAMGSMTAIAIGTSPTPIIAVRLKETEPYNRKTLLLKSLSVFNASANNYIQWDLHIFPDSSPLTGGTGGDGNTAGWFNVNSTHSCSQYNVSSTTLSTTNGILIDSGYTDFQANVRFDFDKYIDSPRVNSSIIGKSKMLCLSGIQIGGGVNVNGSMSWIEVL